MKFEAAYKKGFDNFIRVFNENTKKSEEARYFMLSVVR